MSNTTVTPQSPPPSVSGRTPRLLTNLWDDAEAAKLEARPLDLLRYRSNLLGTDLRITNFGGGKNVTAEIMDGFSSAASSASPITPV